MVGKTALRAVEEAAVLNQDVGRAAQPRPEGPGFASFTNRACKFLHTGEPGAAATGKKGRKDKRRKDR